MAELEQNKEEVLEPVTQDADDSGDTGDGQDDGGDGSDIPAPPVKGGGK